MIPMMIPFIMLLDWSISTKNCFKLENGERVEEINIFGQYQTKFALIKPKNIYLEEFQYLNNLDCDIENLEQVDDLKNVKFTKDKNSKKIIFEYGQNGKIKKCIFELR